VPYRYVSADEDSGRWADFPFRDGDIVISTRSKHGTTWMQMICALLIHRTDQFPEPLGRLSPWLDQLTEPREQVVRRLEAQPFRRVIKTHTPLDGVPYDPRVSYVVVARYPPDGAVSLYHQGNNIDRRRLAELTGAPYVEPAPRPPIREWLLDWIRSDAEPRRELDSLPGVLWHLSDAWARRQMANVILVRYEDLQRDLEATMRALAARLALTVPEGQWPALVEAASFEAMRAQAVRSWPSTSGVLRDPLLFFRRGRSGAASELLTNAEIAEYYRRAGERAPVDLLDWLHRGR
jgi:aryl sulfotransferase